MENNNERRPILFKGEVYGGQVKKRLASGPKNMRFTYEEAKQKVLENIANTNEAINNLNSDQVLPNEIIIGLTLLPEFNAKSYYPGSFFDGSNERFGLTEIGSRVIHSSNYGDPKNPSSKLIFVRATREAIKRFEDHLRDDKKSTAKFKEDIQKVADFGLLPIEEQILGLSEEWTYGKLEAVLHPFDIDDNISLPKFIELLEKADVNMETVRYKKYESGITFVSFNSSKDSLSKISGFNPLRTLHPLELRQLPEELRGTPVIGGPLPPNFTRKSNIKVGVLDGGLNKSNPYTINYTDIGLPHPANAPKAFIDHGTHVTGAVLYGALNTFADGVELPEPRVSVINFGILDNDQFDPELYDAIDKIEDIVPNNSEIKVYNLSLGPSGPILDDSISRFTYACDKLAYDYNVLFCVAVGNDGLKQGYNRIQSPSDAVNALAVGAYSNPGGTIQKAPYSCIGPGREGGKMKPDVMAFGGCSQIPIHLIGDQVNQRVWSAGTSYAAPIVAGLAGTLIGESSGAVNSLVAKTLIVHKAITSEDSHSLEMGHGHIPNTVDELVECLPNSYTLIYEGELDPGTFASYPIPWDNISSGKATFDWTVSVLTDVDQLSIDDYTSSSVELTFYPNSSKYRFTDPQNSSKAQVVNIKENPSLAKQLEDSGWRKSAFPVSDPVKPSFMSEAELRTTDLKWDSVDNRVKTKRALSIESPFFHVHTLKRGTRNQVSKVKFAIILTVSTPKAEIDLYQTVLNNFPALVQLQLEIPVRVNVQNDH